MLVVFKRLTADVAGAVLELARIISSAASRLESGRLPFNSSCIALIAAELRRYLGWCEVVNGTVKC